jgi:hypothetical protein
MEEDNRGRNQERMEGKEIPEIYPLKKAWVVVQ